MGSPCGRGPSSHTVLSVSAGRMYLIWSFWEGPSAPKNCWAAPSPLVSRKLRNKLAVFTSTVGVLCFLFILPVCLFTLTSLLLRSFYSLLQPCIRLCDRWHINRSQQWNTCPVHPGLLGEDSESELCFSGCFIIMMTTLNSQTK